MTKEVENHSEEKNQERRERKSARRGISPSIFVVDKMCVPVPVFTDLHISPECCLALRI